MEKYDLNPKDLYTLLKEKNINSVFHANTISTSITFLQNQSLLSRKFVADNNLFQTTQYSDEIDKKFDIWNDIFLDFVDIHNYFGRDNYYGPLLFCFDVEILNSDLIKCIRITKKNPVNWNDSESPDNWYYESIDDFGNDYMKGNKASDIGKMLIIKKLNGKLPLRPFITKFILDNPNIFVSYKSENVYLAEILKREIDKVLEDNNYTDIPKQLRHNNKVNFCKCWINYNIKYITKYTDFKRLFHPKP